MQRNDETNNKLEIDIAVLKFVSMVLAVDIMLFGYFWWFYE